MHWIAPSEKDTDTAALEKHFWDCPKVSALDSGNLHPSGIVRLLTEVIEPHHARN
jgi:hypothetical protein